MVKILGIMGSPRRGGNTEIALREAFKSAEQCGVETEVLTLIDKQIDTCYGCQSCRETGLCRVDDDFMEVFEKMRESNGIVFASPSYCESVTPQVKALMDRAAYYNILALNRSAFTGKIGAAIAVTARTGAATVWSQIVIFLLSHRMIVPGISSIPNVIGLEKGDALKDIEGLEKMRELGKVMVELARLLF